MRSTAKTAVVALVTVIVLLLSSGPALAAESGRRDFYLSLGDSLAYGFQRFKVGHPAEAFDTGYADLLADRLESRPTLVNYGCPGETTDSFAVGGCPWTGPMHDAFTGAQLAAAVRFLRDASREGGAGHAVALGERRIRIRCFLQR